MALTAAHIESALRSVGAQGGQMRSYAELAAGANTALQQAPPGLTVKGAAAFLATMMQESAFFRTTTEYTAGRNRYSPFDGRTFEMITWESNYSAFGRWLKGKGLIDDAAQFVKNPRSLADYRWAWLGGVWFFEANDLWPYANRGEFLAVSRAVNLGNPHSSVTPNGWSHRQTAYSALRKLGKALLPSPAATAKPKSVKPQRGAVGTVTADQGAPARTVPGGKFVRVKGKIPRRRKGYRLKIGGVRKKGSTTWVTGVNRGWWHNAAAFDFHLPARKKLARPAKGAVAVADKSVPARSVPGGRFVRIQNKIPRRKKGYKLWIGGIRKTKDGTVWITGPNGGWWHNAAAFTYYSR